MADQLPEPQVASTLVYSTQPSYVSAEQFYAGKTSMSLVKLLSTNTDYTVSPAAVSANVQSLTGFGQTYVVHDTDWVVLGPNLESVYTNAQFTQLFTGAPGNAMSMTLAPLTNDPMTVQLNVYIAGAAGTLDVDWGDGSAHATPAVVLGANVALLTHTYANPGPYTVWVKFLVASVQVNASSGVFIAVALPPPANDVDMSTSTYVDGSDPTLGLTPPPSAASYAFDVLSPVPVGEQSIQSPDMPNRDRARVVAGGANTPGVVVSTGVYTDTEMQQLLSGQQLSTPGSDDPLDTTPPPS